MAPALATLTRLAAHRAVGYTAAVLLPVATTWMVWWLQWPAFVFEHLVVLLVVGFAIPWGLGPAGVSAIVAVGADNVLLREPIGQPAITGTRDIIDLALFATVAIIVSALVARAHRERLAAGRAARLERQARQERDRLIATVSHDLATPLSVLSGTIQFARRFGPASEADLNRLLVRLDIATARASSLVKTLTDARALEADDFTLNLARCDLRELVAPIVQMMDRLSDRHPVVVAMPDRPVMVDADADRLHRVVENLLNNAIKYSPDGGAVEVSIEVEPPTAVLRVRDHGIGISREARPRIFDRSFRAPEAVATAPGLGLGLSIAAQVIARHGGTIEAQAAEGAGTIMSLRLPLAGRDGGLAEAAAEHAGVPIQTRG